ASLVTAGLLVVAALAACSTNATQSTDAGACAELSGTRIPASAIGLPTTGGQVTATKLMPATGAGATVIPEYCRVDAALHPVDPTAPDIKLAIALPTNWNSKAMMFGGGGY